MIKYVFVLLLASCAAKTNPKEAIVERQKAIKTEQKRMADSMYSVQPTVDTTGAFQNEVKFNRRMLALQKEYDSLEVDLKKY